MVETRQKGIIHGGFYNIGFRVWGLNSLKGGHIGVWEGIPELNLSYHSPKLLTAYPYSGGVAYSLKLKSLTVT